MSIPRKMLCSYMTYEYYLYYPFVHLMPQSNVSYMKQKEPSLENLFHVSIFVIVCSVVSQKWSDNNMDDQEKGNRRQGLRANRGNLNKSIKNPWREANIFSRLLFWLVSFLKYHFKIHFFDRS